MKPPVEKAIRIAGALLFGVVLAACLYVVAVRNLSPAILRAEDVRLVERWATQIESFKATHGSYPRPEDTPPPRDNMFYSLSPDGGSFIVGFSAGFDEDYSFDSERRKWSFEKK